MKNLYIKIFTYFCIVGTFGLLFYFMTGSLPSFLNEVNIGGNKLYVIDVYKYLTNLQDTLTLDVEFIWEQNTKVWQNNYVGDMNIGQLFTDISNNLAYMFNVAINILNLILFFPINLAIYVIDVLFALIGINVTAIQDNNNLSWIKDIVNFMKNDFKIPLIQ